MRFDGIISVATASPGADPVAAPEDVPRAAVVTSKSQRSDRMVSRWLLAVEGAAGETLDVELFTLAEGQGTITPGTNALRDAPDPAADIWIRFGVETLTANILTEVLSGPPGGRVYVRVTGVGTLAGTQSLHIACVD